MVKALTQKERQELAVDMIDDIMELCRKHNAPRTAKILEWIDERLTIADAASPPPISATSSH